MDFRSRILWIDGIGGAVVGLVVLALHGWLASLYQLPIEFILFMGLINLLYGCYSLPLAFRKKRPLHLIIILIIGNLAWAALCFWWAYSFRETASIFGMIHLIGEGIYVGGLGLVEWRWRKYLQTVEVL